MSVRQSNTPGPLKTTLVILLLIGVPLAALFGIRALQGPPAADANVEQMDRGIRFIVDVTLAILGSIGTVGAYLLVLFTSCFTFRFDRPVYRGFKKRLYVVNILVPIGFIVVAAAFLDALFVAATVALGWSRPPWWSSLVPAMIVANLSTSVFGVWLPVLKRLIEKRLAAQGVSRHQLRTGTYLGISDPGRNDWRKTVLEDDLGMLWIEKGRLTYRGDVDEFSVTPDDLARIERVSVSASLHAYFGVRHIVLSLQDGRRIRLHVGGEWTLPGVRRATDRLADRLARWKAAGSHLRTAVSA